MEFNNCQTTFVVQGPIRHEPRTRGLPFSTARCLTSIRQNFPDAEIVLSTWRGADVNGLSFDVLVENDDPGPLAYAAAAGANPNINRMIVSSQNGIAAATCKYVVKTRTDIMFLNDSLKKWCGRFPNRSAESHVFEERVVVPTVFSVQPRRGIENRLYHLSDWLQAGTRRDLELLWSCPLAGEITDKCSRKAFPAPPGQMALTGFSNEQYLWLHVAQRMIAGLTLDHAWDHENEKRHKFEHFVANEVVLVEPRRLGIQNLCYRLRFTAELNNFTHGEWLRLYRNYCDPMLRTAPDFRSCFRQRTADLNLATGGRLMSAIAIIGRTVRLALSCRKNAKPQ